MSKIAVVMKDIPAHALSNSVQTKQARLTPPFQVGNLRGRELCAIIIPGLTATVLRWGATGAIAARGGGGRARGTCSI